MNLIKIYYYLYYRMYKISMSGTIKSLSKFYAELLMIILEVSIASSMYIYYVIYINRYAKLILYSWKVFVFIFFIIITNYFSFNKKTDYYIDLFDNMKFNKKIKYEIIIWLIVFMIFLNLIFSFYLMSKIDWSLYRT